MKNILIYENSNAKLNLEASTDKSKYILEGTFATLDKENRNGRIYTKNEYLKHLDYLRKDIKEGQVLLGELDHPDDRFETKLKEVSHRVIDIWYEPSTNEVKGKIELLDTPNGKIAKSMVDEGIDLNISSRAAGSVNERDKKVSIQQLYTYDLVNKGGFSDAVLHRINESSNLRPFMKSINESMLTKSSRNIAKAYGILNENISIVEMKNGPALRKEAIELNKNINIEEMTKPINEGLFSKLKGNNYSLRESENVPSAGKEPQQSIVDNLPIPEANLNPSIDTDIIISVEPIFTEEEKLIFFVEPIFNEDKESKDKNKERNKEINKTTIKEETLNKTNDIKTKREDVIKKLDNVIDGLEKKKTIKESIVNNYPFTACLDAKSLKEFNSLNEQQKNKVVDFLNENYIMDSESVKSLWKNALLENKFETPKWMSLADNKYKKLYESASKETKDAINASAEFLILDSKSQIDNFWSRSGLLENNERQILNESFINAFPKVSQSSNLESSLPYSKELINLIGEQITDMNKR